MNKIWNLLNEELLLEFIEWLRTNWPITFRHLIDQFITYKEREQ